MTDIGRLQAETVEAAPGPPRAQVQVVPLRGLPIVAAVVVLVIAFTVAQYSSPPHPAD